MEKHEKIRKNKRRQLVVSTAAIVSLVVAGMLFSSNGNDAVAPAMPVSHGPKEQELLKTVIDLDAEIRKIKSKCKAPDCFMEVDPTSLAATKKLQDATRRLLVKRYGTTEPIRVLVDLQFQPSIPDYKENGADGSFLIEMAPIDRIPHSVYMFLEIARNWKGGAFHRNPDHVLQAFTKDPPFEELAFQEYHKKLRHREKTLGFAGRPSSSDFYVSILDNADAHGPGTQQDENPHEADSLFGRVIDGYDDTIQRIKKMPGAEGEDAFIDDEKNYVLIKSMRIMVPGGDGSDGYVFWKPRNEK